MKTPKRIPRARPGDEARACWPGGRLEQRGSKSRGLEKRGTRAGLSRSAIRVSALFIIIVAASGCVERLIQVRSDPPGATVYINGKLAGTTPLDYPFDHYGTVGVVLRKDSYQSLRIVQELPAPWYVTFPLDFFTENFLPYNIPNHHPVDAQLEPIPRKVTIHDFRELTQMAERARVEADRVEMEVDIPLGKKAKPTEGGTAEEVPAEVGPAKKDPAEMEPAKDAAVKDGD